MSLTPRNVGQLAATHCDVRHRPESGEVLEKTGMRTINDENCQSRGRGFSRVFSGGWRVPTFDARSVPRVTIRVTTPRDPKGSSGVIRNHFHHQVRHFSRGVTLLMASNRLPKLAVA